MNADIDVRQPRLGRLALAGSAGLFAAGLLLLVFLHPVRSAFLAISTRFDEEGVVSNPDWLDRPIVALAAILIAYALLRFVFQRRYGEALEHWVLVGDRPRGFRRIVTGATFVAIPALFLVFMYAVTHLPFWEAHYSEDQSFENMTAAFLLAAGVLFLAAAVRTRRLRGPWRPAIVAALVLVGAACIFLGLEEISYGQRIFGWRTPAELSVENLQGETNLHNFIDHNAQEHVTFVLGILIFVGAAVAALLRRGWRDPLVAFVPDQAFLPSAAVVLLLSSHAAFHEPLEQIISMLGLLFAGQVWLATRRTVPAQADRPPPDRPPR